MRYETCLGCKFFTRVQQPDLYRAAVIAESLGGLVHHHHTVSCEACGKWWFDDVVVDGLGLPVASRRDTVFCECPAVVIVPRPEADCHCTASEINETSLLIRMGPG
jgi:hypothetical protein